MKIGFQIANNKAHHPHIMGLIKEISVNNTVYLFYFDEADISEIKELFGLSVEYVQMKRLKFTINTLVFEQLYRTLRNLIDYPQLDYKLGIINSKSHIKKLDAFVFTDMTTGEVIKKIDPSINVIWALHGPVSTSHGYSVSTSNVDLILNPGPSTFDSFQGTSAKLHKTGSIKLESIMEKTAHNENSLFPNKNPTVVFNPHFNKNLGAQSWEVFGKQVLDHFNSRPQYNLIFAPHPNLKKIFDLSFDNQSYGDNIIIDIDSKKLSNLFYEKHADIYLGDISSQVLEYIYLKPRPLIFLIDESSLLSEETRKIHSLGSVINSVEEIDDLILKELSEHKRLAQEKFVLNTFYKIDSPKINAAEGIIKLNE